MREVFPNIDFFLSYNPVVAARFGPKGSIFSGINKSVLINIATLGWNEYEKEINCSPQNEAEPKDEGEIQPGVCYYLDFGSSAIKVIKNLR